MSICRFATSLIKPSTLGTSQVRKCGVYGLRQWFSARFVARQSQNSEDAKPIEERPQPSQNSQDTRSLEESKQIFPKGPDQTQIDIYECPEDESEAPKKHIFQELKKSQSSRAIYTMEQAAEYVPMENMHIYYKYPRLFELHTDAEYALRGVDNADTFIFHFPEVTDFLMVGGGLVGSATAYYMKKTVSRAGDVVVLDKAPYSPSNCTALCNGLISSQSKSRDVSRVASLSKELIRNLRNEVLVTKEDFAKINYRPCTHLILWPQSEVEDVVDSMTNQIEDGCYTETKTPTELETLFPWLKACGSDIALGTHGNQDEAVVDPIALRNLYRTLAQGYGANFIRAEVIDFNTMHSIKHTEITPFGAGCVVARLPKTGELRNLGFAKTLLSLGHNTPFLEARSDMEQYMRDQIEDLHFLQPKLRISISFNSLMTPVINFPVITDTDGSVLIREDYSGNFKYYLPYDESESFFDKFIDRFMDLESDEPYPNLIHKDEMFGNYFETVIKPRLVRRIPTMEDAKFYLAYSGFESYNTHDGNPIISPHPFHFKVLLSGGYGSRMMAFAPAAAATFAELMLIDEEETFDMTNFYWNRVIKGRKVQEFRNLIQ